MFKFSWSFFRNPNRKFKKIDKLIEMIKSFNAGAIDKPLTKHIDKVYEEWKLSK